MANLVKYSAIIFLTFCSLFLLNPKNSFCESDRKPVFELGILSGAFTIPKYEGSDERYNIPLIFPYFVYRGKDLKIDKGGFTKSFFDSKKFSLDLGLSLNLPVDSSTNDARTGMPDIPLAIQIGPRLNYYLTKPDSDYLALFRMPVRGAWNIRSEYSGLIIQPNILFGLTNLNGRWKNYCEFGLTYTSSEYNKVFYDVEPAYSSAKRPVFKTGSVLHSFSFSITSLFDITRKVAVVFSAKWRTLGVGRAASSPLVREIDDYSGGILLLWSFWESKELVEKRGALDEANEDVI